MRRTTNALIGCFALTLIANTVSVVTASPAAAFTVSDIAGTQQRGAAWGASGALTHPTLAAVSVGKVALQSLPCNPIFGHATTKESDGTVTKVNMLGTGIGLPTAVPLIKTGTTTNTGVATLDVPTRTADAFETSTTQGVQLLNGLVTATLVEARAHSRLDPSGINSFSPVDSYEDSRSAPDGTSGATIANLTIAGATVDTTGITPNTRIVLPGVGYLVLNEQIARGTHVLALNTPTGHSYWSGIDVNAIHLHLDGLPTAPVGAYQGDVLVGHTETRIVPAFARISGYAYATKAAILPALTVGQQSLVNMPCTTTNGADLSTSQVGLTQGTVVSEGAATSTVNGLITSSSFDSHSSSVVNGITLLSGSGGVPIVTADKVITTAATTGNATGLVSTGSVNVVHLVIDPDAGGPTAPIVIDGPVRRGTKVSLPGLGYLELNQQKCYDQADPALAANVCSSTAGGGNTHYQAITTYGLHLVVQVANTLGLPIGTDVVVSAAHSDGAF